jgi:flagellar hook assembly protein FlgD
MRGTAELRFRLAQEAAVSLSIFDLAGREVARLVDGAVRSGETRVAWDGADRAGRALPAGIYFYRLESPAGTLIRRLVILR